MSSNPIDLSGNRKAYVNGQHRGCALRFSGAEKAAVRVDIETVIDDNADWTYLGMDNSLQGVRGWASRSRSIEISMHCGRSCSRRLDSPTTKRRKRS